MKVIISYILVIIVFLMECKRNVIITLLDGRATHSLFSAFRIPNC